MKGVCVVMGEKKFEIDRFLSLDEAAEFMGNMTPRALADRARAGQIPSYKPGKHLIFDPKDLREYVRRRKLRP